MSFSTYLWSVGTKHPKVFFLKAPIIFGTLRLKLKLCRYEFAVTIQRYGSSPTELVGISHTTQQVANVMFLEMHNTEVVDICGAIRDVIAWQNYPVLLAYLIRM